MHETCWKLHESELVDLTPARARDLIVDCFFFAQHETFARTMQSLGATHRDGAALRANIVSAVRLAFNEAGGDYDHPTRATLAATVAVLARKAESWGTPPDIVQHHARQIEAVLERLGPGA